ncbi:MAG: phosphoenolpyruvate synthase [Gammaproteobacteria bacterium]|nr:phosphoenolpyruvate synthase [Gammaproteobacteria bacterium]
MDDSIERIRRLADLGRADTALVGGKNASLGEMIRNLTQAGIRVPDGFATTADAYREFIAHNKLHTPIAGKLAGLDPDQRNLAEVGEGVRTMILDAEMPPPLVEAIVEAYRSLPGQRSRGGASVAVRSSATAEDLPEASFAGQLESFLNVRGEASLLDAVQRCFASLFTGRAIIYRANNGFDHMQVAVSVGVQHMVRADKGGAGVMFSIDTETGFPRSVMIDAAWGLGETVVQGMVEPDRYAVFKPLLEDPSLTPIIEKELGAKAQKMVYARNRGDVGEATSRLVKTSRKERDAWVLTDEEILTLARWACVIETHYGQPMDMEWARDGNDGALYIVQARPETVQSRRQRGRFRRYRLKSRGQRLLSGQAIGDAVAIGRVCRLQSAAEIDRFEAGAVLVTGNTGPDWVPIMKQAAAIVTEHGGRTSHAAIVSRELGLPAVVGAEGAMNVLEDGSEITVSCAEGATGHVYEGRADFDIEDIDLSSIAKTRTQVMLNLANPAAALQWWQLPADGVGLARMEFIIGNTIKIHPMALVKPEAVTDGKARRQIRTLTRGFEDPTDYFVDTLARGLARIAAVFHPAPTIVRMSDFKTNEYAELIGGATFEPEEENPMLGWRGASRYYSPGYRDGFALECRAVRKAREELGFTSIVIMIPFCRSLDEADQVLGVLADNGLIRGRDGLEVYVMAELPANVLLAAEFAERFDGFSIGSNDLTQLILGADRDSELLSTVFDERNPAVMKAIAQLLAEARASRTHTGLCGQAPSDHPGFARFLVEQGIDSISVTPDSFVAVKQVVGEIERELGAASSGAASSGAAGSGAAGNASET